MAKTLVLLNARAGAIIDAGAERVCDALASSLKDRSEDVEIRLVRPGSLRDEIERAAQSEISTLIVGGGDGSVNAAVHALGGTSKTLGVLPFGTMNLFARDLGMPANIEEAIEAIGDARPRKVDLARVNGRSFHSLSGLGFFSEMARAREEVRGHKLGRLFGVGLAALRALQRTYPFTLDIRTDSRREQVEALAVLITNNRFGPDWRRPSLDESVLEVHIAEHAGALSKLKASANLLTGTWRNDDDTDGIRTITARHVAIGRRRPRTFAATDGELRRERIPLRYEIRPGALTVLSL
ncbi:diacylglycerol/lipid kinase family protein [Pseudorhodoplanes sp.]|uniref:diacylglycerol/lipid kinase family protein n=1 Tax=Pseudorhodoplanes sp. TaxID=1934341 RepID=UPI002BA9CD35|nr:diacylglycerol kinase family protein [Pseudorhodoplanes sp.]HWV55051.1 diacylglycerol kinase family protein [Pseudorhodoplanes sp.]